MNALGVLLATAGAVLFAIGGYLQYGEITAVRAGQRLTLRDLPTLVRRPRWSGGIAICATGGVLHAVALSIAPVSLIQPVAVLALGLSAWLDARRRQRRLTVRTLQFIGLATAGVCAFLWLVGSSTESTTVTPEVAWRVGLPVAVVVLALGLAAGRVRGASRSLLFAAAAGVSYGFTSLPLRGALLELRAGGVGELSIVLVLAVASGLLLAAWFMQQAYASGRPQVGLASVTIVDPIIAVCLGYAVLGEAAGMTIGIGLGELVAAAVAIAGVVGIAVDQEREQVLDRRSAVLTSA